MPAPPSILELVERFDTNRSAYHAPQYNETQLRREFLDPFFAALGWDVDNTQGYAEAYKDVVHEDAIKVGGATKAPDYSFRIGGVRKFFVEAKKPAINLKEDTRPAFQLRRYAWSAKLPLSILTDFEEFAVYDCRIPPQESDKAAIARTLFLGYQDYAARWDEIAAIFSREAILKGAFDRYAEDNRAKRGTAEVDAAFLKEIETWRDALARNLALRNPLLRSRDLNFAVQITIDRIIFLRICEDRGIEPMGRLQSLLNGGNVYARLCTLFREADDRYNSGLFHFRIEKGRDDQARDTLTPGLTIDDKVLKEIFASLYYPAPYAFDVFPADILGQVYEQFLGKVIRLTSGHRAVVEDKPEVKKAGGVYYTPTYIVNYIVEQTVGKLLEGKTPRQVEKLKILDPACGSGSFLIGAYQRLLDWHQQWYESDGPVRHARGSSPKLYQDTGGAWRLTTGERKRILLANLYGVDIDPQAVEVTKLSLLLKMLEGETQQTVHTTLSMFHERVLPDLDANIRCGNSLIGPDFYDGKQLTLLDEDEMYRVNAFDWKKEFAPIFSGDNPGFDAVIGNPPYGAHLTADDIAYLRQRFKDTSQSQDTFEFFLVQASRLLRQEGRLSMIIPASWLTGQKYTASRKLLTSSMTPRVAYAMPFDVFKSAYIDTAVVVFANSSHSQSCLIHYFPKKEKLTDVPANIGTEVPVSSVRSDAECRLSVLLSNNIAPILSKLRGAEVCFGDWFQIQRGIQPYSRKKHSEKQIKARFLHADAPLNDEYMPELQGSELSRYWAASERKSYIRYCDEIASSRPRSLFEGERIVLRRLLTRKFRLQASWVNTAMITTDNVLNLVPTVPDADVKYALGILNSRIISWYYVNTSMIAQKDDFPQVHISALSALPIPMADKARHDRMVDLVEAMLALHKQLPNASPTTRAVLQRQIDATDHQIDRLVYELYGLTDAEIALVEEGTAQNR
ncbi:MAG TPA: N-6 DNA methylase [Chthonomonadaceae bacterium]|nr:N-6 DNA methylase [Chthonomonadaceae bacterium]